MAVLAKKIYIKNSAGTQQTVTLYSTTGEVSTASSYTYQLVDGVTAYAALVSTSHTKATSGRVIKGGTTYAWGSTTPAPAYAYKLFTTAGSGTFTVPTGVTKLRVTCVGGGAGGAIIGDHGGDVGCAKRVGNANLTYESGVYVYRTYNTLGTATTFGSISAATATIAVFSGQLDISCRACGGRDCGNNCTTEKVFFPSTVVSVSKGFNNGGAYVLDNYSIDGGAAVPLVGIDGVTRASVGAGGYADGHYNTPCRNMTVASGGSGYRTISTISVTPGQVISYTVGSGGPMDRANTIYTSCHSNDGTGGCPGSAGGILVEYGSGIE